MVVAYAPFGEDMETITPTPIIPRSGPTGTVAPARPAARHPTKVITRAENKLVSLLKHDKTECNYLILLFLLGVFCLLLSN